MEFGVKDKKEEVKKQAKLGSEETVEFEEEGEVEAQATFGTKEREKGQTLEETKKKSRNTKLMEEEKKEFGVDDRRDIQLQDKEKESDKAKLDKMGEKLTSFTENKDLSSFSENDSSNQDFF